MRMFVFIFVAFVGSATAFNVRSFASKLESLRSEVEATYANHASTDYEITEEVTTSKVTGCLKTEKALRLAVKDARTKGPLHTKVDLCTKNLILSGDDPFGIDVSNKWLDIRCSLNSSRCAMNGQEQYGFFYGFEANIKIDNVDFVEGYPLYFGDSDVHISNSSFMQNFGSLFVSGGDSVKIDNVTFAENKDFTNVFLYNITSSSIARSSFKDNNGTTLIVQNGAYCELSEVTFENNSAPTGELYSSVFFMVPEIDISGALYKSNSLLPLLIYQSDKTLITNSSFDGNYNDLRISSALFAAYTDATLEGVSFVNNILHKKEGNTLGIGHSRVILDRCTFANNEGPVRSTKSSSVRVYDGSILVDDGSDPSTRTNTTLTCAKTKYCDGFPSKQTIVNDFSKRFNAPTCKASRVC